MHKTITIDKTDDYFILALGLMRDGKYIYRGINSDNQKYPKIIRDKDCSKNEKDLLLEFEKYYGLYSNVPNFWEFVTLAQHHGLKTRLIDFTENFFVATFFSLHNKTNKNVYKIYVFDKSLFCKYTQWNKPDDMILSEPDEKMGDNAMLAFKILGDQGKDVLLNPHFSNSRIFAQQGLFIVPGTITKAHIDKLYNRASIEISINPRIRKHILNKLDSFGYDEYHLMPDLDSACREINGKI